eukprot:scaffold43308_cov176-Amphora_coffeaeformis.AAC.1
MFYMTKLTIGQQKALAILPKFTGGLSCLFSLILTLTILRDKSRRRLCYHRLLCGISMVDLSASFWMFMSTWPIPPSAGDNIVWAVGNTLTCRVQGFMLQFGVTSPFYNASLAIYYFLVIVRGWKEDDIRKIEWLLHSFPLAWGLCSALTGLLLRVYGNANLWCWSTADYKAFRWVAYYGPLWCAIGLTTACCVAIYLHVRRFTIVAAVQQSFGVERMRYNSSKDEDEAEDEENEDDINKEKSPSDRISDKSDQEEGGINYDPDAMQESDELSTTPTERRIVVPDTFRENLRHSRYVRRQSRRLQEIARQCFWYAMAFYINFAALTCLRILQTMDHDLYSYPLVVIAAMTVPMQGLPNFLIYLRPKLKKTASNALARYCCCCRPEPSPPWWYRLAKSLSDKNNRHSDVGRAMGSQVTRGRAQSSAAIVIVDPTVINDKPYYPKERIHAESQNEERGQTVLVVVDTNEGRRWHIESKSSDPANSKYSHTTRSAEQVEEQTASGSTKDSHEKNESIAQELAGDDEASNKGSIPSRSNDSVASDSSSSSDSDW